MKRHAIAGLILAGIVSFAGVLVVRVQASAGAQDTQVYEPGNGVVSPSVKKSPAPQYTDAGRAAKIEGEVRLEAVVEPDGHVDGVKVVKSLDTKYGLDEQAVKAARQWLFKPGTKNGKPVAVRVQIVLEFRIWPPF